MSFASMPRTSPPMLQSARSAAAQFQAWCLFSSFNKQCLLIKEPGNQCGKGYLQHRLDCFRRFLSGKACIYLHNASWQSYPFGQAAVVTRSASMPPDWAKQRNFYSLPPHRHPAMWQSNCEANQNHLKGLLKFGGVLCRNPPVSSWALSTAPWLALRRIFFSPRTYNSTSNTRAKWNNMSNRLLATLSVEGTLTLCKEEEEEEERKKKKKKKKRRKRRRRKKKEW